MTKVIDKISHLLTTVSQKQTELLNSKSEFLFDIEQMVSMSWIWGQLLQIKALGSEQRPQQSAENDNYRSAIWPGNCKWSMHERKLVNKWWKEQSDMLESVSWFIYTALLFQPNWNCSSGCWVDTKCSLQRVLTTTVNTKLAVVFLDYSLLKKMSLVSLLYHKPLVPNPFGLWPLSAR